MLKNSNSFPFIILAFFLSQSPFKCQANSFSSLNAATYGYPKSFERCIEQPNLGKTLAEVENNCARQSFEEKQQELNAKVHQIMLLYEKNNRTSDIEKLRILQSKFATFLKDYGKLHASPFLRSHPYHYYGSMINFINVRLSHLETLKNELE